MPAPAALALAALLAAEPATAPRDQAEPPPGAPADQRLWRDLRDSANDVVLHMARLAQGSFRLSYGRYYEGLDAIAADPAAPDRDEARALRRAIEGAARAAEEALPQQPGVRECRYVLRDLDLAMPLAGTEPRAAQALAEARPEARRCVERLAPLARTLGARADALEAALAAADGLATRRGTPLVSLGASPPPAPAAPAKEAP